MHVTAGPNPSAVPSPGSAWRTEQLASGTPDVIPAGSALKPAHNPVTAARTKCRMPGKPPHSPEPE